MRTIYTPDHKLHTSPGEFSFGEFLPAFEKPERAELVRERIEAVKLGPIEPPARYPLSKITAVHDAGLVDFLESAYAGWQEFGRTGGAYPSAYMARGMRTDRVPTGVDGKLSFYCFDAATPITATTYEAAIASANVALTAADVVKDGARSSFALCRPPGHHAGADHYGGFCFFNNAAIAAQHLRDNGARRIAILDVDYHHGNGTQHIFWRRGDVLVVNIHADPNEEYPYLLGYADEIGDGEGEGLNLNLPLPWGTGFDGWFAALEAGCHAVEAFAPDAVIVSLGVDTFKEDPISHFLLDSPDYLRIGARIARLGLPTLFVMEGGYAVEAIGINAVNVLTGFEG